MSKVNTTKRACPTGKARYRDRVAAMLTMAGAQRKDGSRRPKVEVRAYRCGECGGGWHLTSRARRRSA